MQKKIITKEKALERLESLCSRSEQCESDLDRKMTGWGLRLSDRREVLESLRENRFVDDARFARSYANDKARFSAWGPYKIRMELVKRKIKAPVVAEALNGVEKEIWKEGLLRCARTKAKSLDFTGEEAYENKLKLYRYLIGRGFPSETVRRVVEKIRIN